MSEKIIKNPSGSDHNFAPSLTDYLPLPHAKSAGSCLRQSSLSLQLSAVSLYISYTLCTWSRDLNKDFTFDNSLFGLVKLTTNTDPDKCGYSGCGTGFDTSSKFSLPDGN